MLKSSRKLIGPNDFGNFMVGTIQIEITKPHVTIHQVLINFAEKSKAVSQREAVKLKHQF